MVVTDCDRLLEIDCIAYRQTMKYMDPYFSKANRKVKVEFRESIPKVSLTLMMFIFFMALHDLSAT